MSKPKKVLDINTAYDIHSILDHALVETVVQNKSFFTRFRVQHKYILPAEKIEYPDAELIVEIRTYWDGVKDEREPKTAASTNKTRH